MCGVQNLQQGLTIGRFWAVREEALRHDLVADTVSAKLAVPGTIHPTKLCAEHGNPLAMRLERKLLDFAPSKA